MDVEYMCQHSAEDICKMKYALVEYLEGYINTTVDFNAVSTNEAGAVVDMIKDLAEAEKDCAKACYYRTVAAAMGDDELGETYRLGYIPEYDSEPPYRRKENRMEYMRNGIRAEEELDPKYSKTFNEYRKAKRYYTETKTPGSKKNMDTEADQHLAESIDTFKEIWADADTELKRHMKTELTNLVATMTV